MKNPLMMPAYLCGECGIEMLIDTAPSSTTRATERAVTVSCYTPRCPQRGVKMKVPLTDVGVEREDSLAT